MLIVGPGGLILKGPGVGSGPGRLSVLDERGDDDSAAAIAAPAMVTPGAGWQSQGSGLHSGVAPQAAIVAAGWATRRHRDGTRVLQSGLGQSLRRRPSRYP